MNRRVMMLALTALGLGVLVVLVSAFDVAVTQAQGDPPEEPDNGGYCLLCHADTDQTFTLPDGGTLELGVSQEMLAASVHGDANPMGAFVCTDCHADQSYPHEGAVAANERVYTVAKTVICIQCHTDQTAMLADGMHAQALANGNFRAATCVDCHGAHDVQPPEETRTIGAEACGTCHKIAFAEYERSVHGQALFAGDTNVPTCVDCHGVHGIEHPTTALFRNRSPELCAGCHGDDELMAQYDISTNVFDSYLSDFHGTTVQIFEQQDPNVATNKAVCYDCHGVHNIAAADAESSQVIRENLLETCQLCHQDATSNFPDSWVGHYEPTMDSHPVLYAVNLFYLILIPGVLGGFAVMVGTDIFRRVRQRLNRAAEHKE
ncbi:MAG: cytochrome c3 family protein [Anaerolineae bacterium]|nr:cytochrome c3 family protein [Anaerolineae bacterium]